jgi:hypothetical protein
MFQHEFERAYATGTANGLVAERLARWCCMAAERPYGWGGAGDPGLDSSAADRYAAHWLGIVAGTEPKPPPAAGPPFAYNPDVPAQLQYQSWTCSIRSTMWMLSSLGYPVNVATQQDLMTPWPVGVNVGLLARDGSGLAQFIRDTYGLPCYNVYEATWDDVLAVAGRYPCALGGVGWYHWVGVRRVEEDGGLGLANPAPGYREIWNYLSQDQFEGPLGPFALVVIEVGEEDPVAIAELEAQNAELISKLGYLQGDVANGIQQGLDGAVAATDDAARAPAYDAIQAGINTLRNA